MYDAPGQHPNAVVHENFGVDVAYLWREVVVYAAVSVVDMDIAVLCNVDICFRPYLIESFIDVEIAVSRGNRVHSAKVEVYIGLGIDGTPYISAELSASVQSWNEGGVKERSQARLGP